MPLFLGHTTAERLLDEIPVEQMKSYYEGPVENCLPSQAALSKLDLQLLEDIEKPYDVLVSSSNEMRRWSDVRCHRCPRDLPHRAFIEIADDVYVASPALCMVLRAQELSLQKTMLLGSRSPCVGDRDHPC